MERVAHRGHLVAGALEARDDAFLLPPNPQLEPAQQAAVVELESVREQAVSAELLHQRLGQLVERVRDDHHLAELPEPRQEVPRAQVRLDGVGDRLQLAKREAAGVGRMRPAPHQLVEVAQVPGRERQIGEVEVPAEDGPDFGRQTALEVEREDHEPMSLA